MTLRDIGKVTGFTVNTVSRALKGKADISPRTRQLIQTHARRMGYVPNALAVSLRSGKTRTISAIIPDISDPLFAILVRDIEAKLKEKNFDLFIQNTDEDDALERRAILAAIGKKIDGIIICPCQKNPGNLSLIRNSHIPFVLVGRRSNGAATSYVVADDMKGGFLAAKHLIDRGHADILFLNGPAWISSARERLLGYKKALRESRIRYREDLVLEARIRTGECVRLLRDRLKSGRSFSSVFCFSDLMAWETISFLQSKKIRIPEDVAIVGFDDIQSRLYYPYPLTSIGYGKKTMAENAVEAVMEMVESPGKRATRKVVVDVDLVVRKST